MATAEFLSNLRERAVKGLTETLDFFIEYAKDPDGGFYGAVGRDLIPVKPAIRSVVLNARLVWAFASAYRVLGEHKYLDAALHAFRYLKECFIDPEYGGAYWRVNADGTPIDERKVIYGQAFIIYSGAELYRACALCGDPEIMKLGCEARQMAIDVFGLCEEYALDKPNGGYFETFDRKWNRMTDSFNIPDPSIASKALNTHLHVIEAYTNLMRVWDDLGLRMKVGSLIDIMSYKLLDRETFHYKPYMTDDWQTAKKQVSFGHDIEAAWLLVEAAREFGDKTVIEDSKPTAVRIAASCREEGVDPGTGGMWSEYEAVTDEYDKKMIWWVQAEAVVGFFNAYELTGEQEYLDYTLGVWDYIDRSVIDREGGVFREWLTDASQPADNSVNRYTVNEWKTPYHNGRMYMELIERIDKMLEG